MALAGPQGEVGKDMALAAFAAAYGPAPGFPKPQGKVGNVTSGTAALEWITTVWDELTDQQRESVLTRFGGAPGGTTPTGAQAATPTPSASPEPTRTAPPRTPSRTPRPASSPKPTASTTTPTQWPTHTDTADGDEPPADPGTAIPTGIPGPSDRVPTFLGGTTAARTAFPESAECRAGHSPEPAEGQRMVTLLRVLTDKLGLGNIGADVAHCRSPIDEFDEGKSWPLADTVSWVHEGTTHCVITVYPSYDELDMTARDGVLVHELTHCVIRHIAKHRVAMPAWVSEGVPNWTSGVITNHADAGWWKVYLEKPNVPLTERSYDAQGFWFELTYLGIDLWPHIGDIVRAAVARDQTNTLEAFRVVLGLGEEKVLGSWPSSVFSDPGRGPAWTTAGPNMPKVDYLPARIRLTNDGGPQRFVSRPYGTAAVLFDLQADVVRFSADQPVSGRFGPEGGGDLPMPGALGNTYCTLGAACRCPEDSPGAGTRFERVPRSFMNTAFTGGSLSLELTGKPSSLADFCKDSADKPQPPPPPPPPQGPWPVCQDGPQACRTAGTYGDPHLQTFDGVLYDLQSAGEFTLAASLDDGMRVQTRQATVTSSRDMTANVAVAADIGGDRFGIYLDTASGAVSVKINGKAATTEGTAKLPRGGTLTRAGDITTVTWPDRSQLYVRTIQRSSLSVYLSVPDTRKGRLNGLLGDHDGNPENDLDAGSGILLDTAAPPFDKLHGVYADHWRIRQDRSLFDYAPGETTATFTDRSVPTKPLTAATVPNRADAEATCRAAGLTEGRALDSCVIDVAVTGNPGYTEASAVQKSATTPATNPPGASIDPACLQGKEGPKTRTMVFNVGETVAVGGTGRLLCGGYLPPGEWRHHFLVSDKTGKTVDFTRTGNNADCRIQWTVYRAFVSNSPVVPKVSVCQDLGPVTLEADTVFIVVIDAPEPAIAGLYGFTVT